MIRSILTIALFSVMTLGFAQGKENGDDSEKIARLQTKNNQLTSRVTELESVIFDLRNQLNDNKKSLKEELNKGLELQAQNERAMNLALDEFAQKFEKQNETVKGVQEELSQKFNNQMVMFALAFVALVIVFVISSRAATAKALKQNVANWNQFQEHLLKK